MEPPVHPFAATIELMRNGGSFAALTEQQRWEWYADAYAHRQVMLGQDYLPCDLKRKWFDAARVELAAHYYTAKLELSFRARGTETQREGRALLNSWARTQGFETIDAFAEARGIDVIGASVMAGRELIVGSPKKQSRPKAREYTPAEMVAARWELGIPDPDAAERAA